MVNPLLIAFAILVCLTGSAFFSGMEAAVFSMSRFRIKTLLIENRPGARTLERLKANSHITLGGMLFGNLLVNTAASTLAALLVNALVMDWPVPPALLFIVDSVLMTSVLLVCGEITPKTITIADPQRYALRFGFLLSILIAPFRPLTVLLNHFFHHIIPHREPHLVTDEEIKYMLTEAKHSGIVDEREERFAYQIMKFGRIAVREIMTPRIKVAGVSAEAEIEKVLTLIRRTRHSRICVFDASREVVGVLYAKDLFPDAALIRVKSSSDLMREPYYVPETKHIDSLLEEFRKKGIHFAVVVDEFGSFTGVVTLEDILESLFGEIIDEYEPVPELPYQKIDEHTYVFAGDTGINDLRQVFGDQFPGEDGERLAGIILRHLGRFPRRKEAMVLGRFTLTVDDTRNREIRRVTIKAP